MLGLGFHPLGSIPSLPQPFTPTGLRADIQSLAPGAIIELFELDARAVGAGIERFHAGTNELSGNVIWQGQTYVRYPVMAEGFEMTAQGKQPRPKLRVSNISGLIYALCRDYQDLVGAKLTRKRTFKKYLDAANFAAGNVYADPNAAFVDDVFFVERKLRDDGVTVEFELASTLDLQGILLPRRIVAQNTCAWTYRGAECGYTGGPVAKSDDTFTADATLDICGKRVASCKLRFGANAALPFGGFPAVGLIRY